MKITILDTYKLYREMLSLPDQRRDAFFDEHFLQPFAPMFETMGMPRSPSTFSCLSLSGSDTEAEDMLNQLITVNAWEEAEKTIEHAMENLEAADIAIPEAITLGIFLGDPSSLAHSHLGRCKCSTKHCWRHLVAA